MHVYCTNKYKGTIWIKQKVQFLVHKTRIDGGYLLGVMRSLWQSFFFCEKKIRQRLKKVSSSFDVEEHE